MEAFSVQVMRTRVPEGGVALWWLAQSGFVFKAASDQVIYVDPYLSNVVERVFGFKRLSLAPVQAEEARADWVLSSHEHLDHLDTDALPVIARNCPACRFAGPQSCMPEYERMGIPVSRRTLLEPGQRYRLGGVDVATARSDHGELSPTALSLLLDFGKTRVLFTGDTALNIPLMQPLISLKPDILLPCINGRFGNLDAEEAAELTAVVSPRAAIPCHFWMFKEHDGDPESFVHACSRRCPYVPVRVLTPGEGLCCTSEAIEAVPSGT